MELGSGVQASVPRRKDDLALLSPSVHAEYALLLVISVVYFVAARLSLHLSFGESNATPVWPPTGIALASILLIGYRAGIGVFVGAFAANVFALSDIGFSLSNSALIGLVTASGNTLEGIVGIALLRRFTGRSYPFERARDAYLFVLFAALLSTMISTTIGVTMFCLKGGDWAIYEKLWLTWWLGDAAGAVVVTPMCVAWSRIDRSDFRVSRIAEAIALYALLSVVSVVVFAANDGLKYLALPILLWMVFRLGLFEVSLSVALLSCFALYTAVGSASGPHSASYSLHYVQSYISVMSITALVLSSALTERKQIERAVRSEKAFADTIIDSVPGAFYVLDRFGRMVRWNHFLQEINQLGADELVQMDSLKNIHAEDKQLVAEKIHEAFATGLSQTEGRVCTDSGIRHFLFTGRRVDVEGTPYVVGSGMDITDHKVLEAQLAEHQRSLEAIIERRTAELVKANNALEAEIKECMQVESNLADSEKQYRDLVEGAASVILRWQTDGKVTFINAFAERFFGYEEKEILGRNIIGTIVPTKDSAGRDMAEMIRTIFDNPGAYLVNENENIRRNGERVWISWTNKPITDDTGAVVEILSVGNDITDRKIAEDRLKQTLEELAAAKERAEAADHLKSAFLATMSHELRTPLNSIIGFTGIMLQGYVGELNDEQLKQLSMVQNSANHLLSLINDVLDISKIEAGQLQVSFAPLDLKRLVGQSVQSIRPAADKKALRLSVSMPQDLPPLVTDARRVEQILLNLLSNAVKFTEKGEIHVECTAGINGFVTLSVRDTGIGIREEDERRLFKAFQQVDTGTTRKFEGTGLGLYICQRLLDLLGGRIWLESTWGVGTTVYFSLPTTVAHGEDGNENDSGDRRQ